MNSLANGIQSLFKTCDINRDWSAITASLIPKLAVPKSAKDFRPIASLVTLRKLIGYVFLLSLPDHTFESFQCGFVPGRDATQAVFCVKRLGEIAREWNKPLSIAQLDMSKAFDKVKHSAILKALHRRGAGENLIAFVASMLQQSTVKLGLGSTSTRVINLDRGVPQGAPESPLLFISVTDMALAELFGGWKSGAGLLHRWSLAAVCCIC